ncbi:hypothetical protein N7445_001955 [Penicillium cf. griseofulvum]|nr:hypothetical protein N7445_001955 [Penicillium cf. griseofulvum]
MKSISTSLVLFLCFLTAMVEGLTRYQTTPPKRRHPLAHPEGLLYPENGGYYLKDGDEVVVGIASDDLCTELDGAFASMDAKIAQEGEGAGSEDNTSDAENVIKRAENALHNSCSHPRCFTHPHCLTYSHCHICSSRKHCI